MSDVVSRQTEELLRMVGALWGVGSDESARVHRALKTAEAVYGATLHWSGARLIDHSRDVLAVTLRYSTDETVILAAILHHLGECSGWTRERVEKEWGKDVHAIVAGGYLLSRVTLKDRKMSQSHLRDVLLQVSGDVRVILFLFYHQLALLQHGELLAPDVRMTIARDALQLYAPVATRLGMYDLKHRFEECAFPVMYPVDSARITEQLVDIEQTYAPILDDLLLTIEEYCRSAGLLVRVECRQKKPYSIFCKMKEKSLTGVADLYDLFAMRIIVATEQECYQALGLIHRMCHPLQNRFKDFIAFPKPNGYKSLHTTVTNLPGAPEGFFLEVQIRTDAMHREASLGLAAHWSYKEQSRNNDTEHALRIREALRAMSFDGRSQPVAGHSAIYVLTPKGELIELAEGACPLDLAFHVHSDLGLSFKHARVNGSIVSLDYQLQNGDTVEIIRAAQSRPSPGWLKIVKGASAKSRLRRFFSEQNRSASVLRGKEMVNEELRRLHLPVLDADLTALRRRDSQELTFQEREDVLREIGEQKRSVRALLLSVGLMTDVQPAVLPVLAAGVTLVPVVEGSVPLPLCFAKCCRPDAEPGCALTGIIGRTGDVRVHRDGCAFVRTSNPERRIKVRWGKPVVRSAQRRRTLVTTLLARGRA